METNIRPFDIYPRCPTVCSGLVELHPLRIEDVSQRYVDWLNDPEVNRTLASQELARIESVRAYVQVKTERPDIWFWKIIHTQDNVHVGNLKLDPISFDGAYAWYGILIGDKRYWGKGLATEATRLALSAAFTVGKLNRIFLGVYAENSAALSVYDKCGFEIMSTHPDGRAVDPGVVYMKAVVGNVATTVST